MNTNVSSVTALSVAPSQSNIIPFDPSTLSVKQLTKLGYTRSKIVKIKNLKPHRPVMPIKSLDDIQKCKDYFLNQETNYRNKSLNIRNYAIFCLDINIGLRASDLLFLKISDIMSARNTFKNEVSIIESKTGKTKIFNICNNAKEAIIMYLETRPNYQMDEYLFTSKKSKNEPLTPNGLWRIIKKMQNDVGIKQNLGSHSLRKTMGYQKLKMHDNDPYVLATIQKLYNHSSTQTTLRYLGIDQDVIKDFYTKDQL